MRRFAFLFLSLMVLFGCDPDSHTTVKPPDAKAWTVADIDAVVKMELRSIHSPAPAENGRPPAECDEIRYFVLSPKNIDAEPDAVLMLSPGMQMGAGSLSHLAKNLIYMAKTYKDADIKVLIVERRANCLEDLTGVNAAEEARDIQPAIDYYYNGKSIDGKRFQGFVTSDQAPYLSEFGIKLNVEDIYTVITTEVPDPATRRQKLFLAGHSISGFTLGFFAGWDFDGDPATVDDAGYRNCAGFIALDTLIAPATELVQAVLQIFPKKLATQLQSRMYSAGYESAIADLRNGKAARISSEAQAPEGFMLKELNAMQADRHPHKQSTLFDRVPYSDNVHQYLNSALSGTYLELMKPNSYKRIRCTNLALSGLLMDNHFNFSGGHVLSIGFLGNGQVADKTFPIPNMLEQVPLMAELLPGFVPLDLYYPTEKKTATLYQWINFDEILQSQYTTPDNEVVDIYDYVRAVYSGPLNYFEWYFPSRVMVDVMNIGLNEIPTDHIHFHHPDFEGKVPILNFFSETGLIAPYVDTSKHDHIYLKGYTHSDPIMAAADRLERRPNEVIEPMIDFILTNSRKQ